MLIHTYVVYDSRRILFDFWEQMLTCNLNFASFLCTETHPLLYDDDTITHAANYDIKRLNKRY